MKKMIPDNAFYTAEVRLNGTAVPGYSSWQGEIDISSLSCVENPDLPFHVSSVQALLDDVEGLGVTLQAKSHLVEPKPRHNIIQRVWLAITNHTATPISFEDKRLVFFGRGATVGFDLPRHALPVMEPTTGTPFEVLDLDGIALDTSFVNATNAGSGTGDMIKAVYDPGNTGQAIPQPANQAEAEAGSNNAKYMTPLRVKQALDYSEPHRDTLTVTTMSLASGATDSSLQPSFGSFGHLLSVTTNIDAWVRVYRTPTDLANDAARLMSADPPIDGGILSEAVTLATIPVVFNRPRSFADMKASPDGTLAVAIKNLSGSTQAVSVTWEKVTLEF